MMIDTKILAYIGAIIDGEGCLSLTKRYEPAIIVQSTSRELVDYLNNFFPTTIKYFNPKNERCMPQYRWDIYGYPKIEDFLLKIIPYLIIKREQGKLLLEFVQLRIKKTSENKRAPRSERENFYYREIKRLKKEYPNSLPDYIFTKDEKEYYFAGLVDGEGTIRIAKAQHRFPNGNMKLILTPQASVGNTDKRVTDFLLREFGGFVTLKKRELPNRDLYQWQVQGNKIEFFNMLRDKLIIKEKQLNLVLEYLESRKVNHKRTEREIDIFLRIRELNRKGKEEYNKDELMELTKWISKPRKFFITKEELNNLYWNKQMSTIEIAKAYGLNRISVQRRLKNQGIQFKDNSYRKRYKPLKFIVTKEELYRLYWTDGKSTREIGREYNVCKTEVARNMRKLNIPLRHPNGYKNKDIKGELSTHEE